MVERGNESLRTARLLLRRWRPEDKSAFAALNADPEVMRYMPRLLRPEESHRWAESIEDEFERDGFGLWALELPGEAPFIGFTGLNRVPFKASFTPAVEIGWRLAPQFWGRGYASEAARVALEAGFGQFGLNEIVSETAEMNAPSRRVMERIGLRRDAAGSFANPYFPSDHPCAPHVLYRATREPDGRGRA